MPSRPSADKRRPPKPPGSRRAEKGGATTGSQLTSSSPDDTERLGRAIGRSLRGGEILALYGPLGAGKTALVRGIAAGLGAVPASVSSPTFVLIHEYHGRLPLAHVDLYRISSLPELESTGLADYLSGPTVMAIEWADKARSWLPDDRLEIELHHLTAGSRRIKLRALGPLSTGLLLETTRRFRRPGTRTGGRRRKSEKG